MMIGHSGFLGTFGALLVAVVALFAFTLYIVWAMNDAHARGKSVALVLVAVVLFFPWGLIAWLIFRPERRLPSGALRA